MHIEVREVGPRDGLQVEAPISIEDRATLIDGLAAAGLTDIEAVSFVSPAAVPAMADPDRVMAAIHRHPGVRYWGLVPNVRGAELAVAAGMDALTITVSACPVYNQKNIRRRVEESMAAIADILDVAGLRPVDLILSCVFGSPYTGDEPSQTTPELISQARQMGVGRFTLADTTGMATPTRVRSMLETVGTDVGLHLHDTRGTALVNAWEAISCGVRRFDAALGGLGGSPFAEGAGGNLATEDLIHILDDADIHTGVDLGALLALGGSLREMVGHELSSAVAQVGPR
ncbi:MAG: hydroxymethylglutaryl-CoA lyase [Acidimicrobiia bacterium]|nr:hydroxymethylglutaryl-CoA lyase [Acidimicrobiia bacterium]